MSRAIASARQRRAGIQPNEPPTPPVASVGASAGANSAAGLTLPQVIALIDTRLIKLEKFMKDTQESPQVERSVSFAPQQSMERQMVDSVEDPEGATNLEQVLGDFNDRFMMLAEEIATLKDTLMKLQSYTMDVNKMLLEERVNVLSDLGTNDKPMFVMEDMTGGDLEQSITFEES